MTFQRIHHPSASNILTREQASPLALRPLAIQTRQNSDSSPVGVRNMERSVQFDRSFASIPVHHSEDTRIGLPNHLKAGIEYLSGLSMDDVTVHQNSSEPDLVHAHAYTQGTDIHLAPGQEQHLPHEAWHVVQQKQGRVQPTAAQAQSTSINDDPGLEREADQMGAQASQANFLGHVQTNTQSPASQSVQRKVIQRRQKVPTNFGEFERVKLTALNSRGVEINLKFSPDESKVDAKKIALAQSVKATHESGAAYVPNPTMANRVVASGKPGAGYVIDASGKTNNPIYFDTKNLGPQEDLKDTPPSANTSAALTQVGVNTHYELGYCYKDKATDAAKKKHPAGLFDQPQGRKKAGAGMMFETAAFAIEGADTGKYYGSVKWGYKIEGTDAAPTVTPIDTEEASKGTPTANFIEPAKLWNVGKTQGTLKVIADPATVYQMDGSTTETLAKNTTIKQLDTIGGGAQAMIKAEVLNANGTGTGKLIFINVSDVKDMGDGSPNKKLPIP